MGSHQKPAVFTVVPPEARLGLKLAPEFVGATPFRQAALQVISVDHESHPIVILFWRGAAIIEPSLVVEGDDPVRRRHPCDRRYGVSQCAKPLLALTQRLLGLFAFCYVVGDGQDALP